MKRRFTLLAVASFLFGTIMAQTEPPKSTEGKYQVSTKEHLLWIADQVNNNAKTFSNEYFEQTANIDLGGIQNSDGTWKGSQWTPIGDNTHLFAGTFDGAGKVIYNLYYYNPEKSYVGLFGGINGAKLKNITLASGLVYGDSYSGGICGYAKGNSEITCCANIASVYGKQERNGGVVGSIEGNTNVSNCINYGMVSAFNYSGGVVGFCSKTTSKVSNCINVGQVFCMRYTAGNCFGYNKAFNCQTSNCYYDNQINTSEGWSRQNPLESNLDVVGKMEGKSTSEMIGNGLESALGSELWTYDANLYPRLTVNKDQPAIILAASPVTLNAGDKADNVTANFTVSTANSVTWTSGNISNLTISSNGKAQILKSTSIVLIATKDEFTKKVYLKTNKTDATPIGSSKAPLTIEKESDLIDLRNAVNNYGTYKGCAAYDGFKGIHFKVTIDLELSDWTEPIGAHNSFKGIFDGNHRTISGINTNQPNIANIGGLFGCASYGKIKNITIECGENKTINSKGFVGGICGSTFCETLENCISNCTIDISTISNVGGIVGVDKGYSTLINCENNGDITGAAALGGILGISNMGSTFIGCKNYGTINGSTSNIAGICGNGGIKFTNCENHGKISGGTSNIGGIVGTINNSEEQAKIESCINSDTIIGGEAACGIAGRLYNTIEVSNCLNLGKISGTDINGICSMVTGTVTVKNCFNAGEIAANGNGISNAPCSKCINIGKIQSGNAIGGNSNNSKCINDTKMCPTSSGKATSAMLGDALQDDLEGTTDWTYTEGMYPMITDLKESDYMKVAAAPIILNETDNATTVKKTLNYDPNSPVEWECSKAGSVILVSFVNGKGYIANPATDTEVVLTAKLGDAKKNIPLNITRKDNLEEPQITWTINDEGLDYIQKIGDNKYEINYGQPITNDMLCATNSNNDWGGHEEYNVKVDSILHAGHHVLTVTYIPNNEEEGAYKTEFVELEVNKGDATPFITWEPAAEITYGDEDSDSKLKNATTTVDGKFYYDIPALTVGTHSLKLEFVGTNYDATIELPDAVEVVAATPAIAWATPLAAIDYGTPLSALQLGAVSGVEGEFTYTAKKGDGDAEPVDIDAILDAGTYTLEATFAPNSGNYGSKTIENELIVNKLKPAIAWKDDVTFAEITYGETLDEDAFNANMDDEFYSFGSLSYFENDEAIDIRSVLPAGTHTITAKFEPTNDNYDTNTAVATVKVNKKATEITWETADEDLTFTYGAALSADKHLNATFTPADAIGEIVYTEGEDTLAVGDILGAGTHVIFATLDESDNFLAAAPRTKTIIVDPIESEITWETPAPIAFGTPISAVELNATANTDGSFTYTLNGENAEGLTPEAGNYTIMVSFTPSSSNYTTANASVTLKVTSVAAKITWATPEAITYGTPISTAQLNATADTEGEYIYSTHEGESVRYIHIGDVLAAGTDSLFVKFIPESEDYGRAVDTVILTVNKAELAVTVADTTVTQGDEMPEFKLVYTGFVNNENESALIIAPTATCAATTAEAGEFDIVVSGGESNNYNITCTNGKLIVVEAVTPVITWADPAAITYGTLISADMLNATANVDGSFTYSVSVGDTLKPGTHKLIATFVPVNNTLTQNVYFITDTVTLTVNKANLTVSVADVTVNQGDEMPKFNIEYKGFVLDETIANLTAVPSAKVNATTDQAGTFDIVLSGGESANYNFEYKNGKLTVKAKEDTTAIADNEVKISVYPNPTADVAIVETDSDADFIYVFNMSGKLVLTEANVGKTQIDLANEPQGTYFVKVGGKTIKLVKF